MDKSSTEALDPTWKGLYKVSGVAALIIAVMYFLAMVIYIPANLASPPPSTVLEWFTLFQDDRLTALFYLGFADIIIMLCTGPMFLALYAVLSSVNKTWMIIATSFAFVGMAVYLATNAVFSMLTLSDQYAAATTEAQKSLLLAAGQATIATVEGTGGRYMGLPLVWVSSLIVSVVMLRSKIFSPATAYVGIFGFALLAASVPFATYTTTGETSAAVAAIIFITYTGGGLLSLAWYILVGVRLTKLGRL
jgi:hypothetical protein